MPDESFFQRGLTRCILFCDNEITTSVKQGIQLSIFAAWGRHHFRNRRLTRQDRRSCRVSNRYTDISTNAAQLGQVVWVREEEGASDNYCFETHS